jgi:hypothetical protein
MRVALIGSALSGLPLTAIAERSYSNIERRGPPLDRPPAADARRDRVASVGPSRLHRVHAA